MILGYIPLFPEDIVGLEALNKVLDTLERGAHEIS